MKRTVATRLLSCLLTLVLAFGLVAAVMPMTASAVVEYATPATQEELDAVAEWFTADNGYNSPGVYAKVINGIVYVWGQNKGGVLGISQYTDINGVVQPVVVGTVVPVPTAIPASEFNNEKITRVKMNYGSCLALTAEGNLYAWGSHFGGAGAAKKLIDASALTSAGRKIVDFNHSGCMVYVKDDAGKWYTYGYTSGAAWNGALLQGDLGTVTQLTVLTPVPQKIYDALGTEIQYISGEWCGVTIVLGANGKLYGFGKDNGGCQGVGLGDNVPYKETPADLSRVIDGLKGHTTRFISIASEDQGTVAVDEDGDVWGWGQNNSSRYGTGTNKITVDSKIFDHNVFQKKAVKAWISFNRCVVLCEDNTVYAMGNNPNGLISPGVSGNVTYMTQVFTELSQSQTIVGVFPANYSQMAITKTGDMFFTGDNASGGAGNGTTTSAPAGTTTPVTSSTMPPSAPLTKNKVSYEIEITEDNKTVTYRPVTTGDGTQYLRTVGNATTTVNSLTVDAGRNFKLNVYFEDFGKLNTFVMPIRFHPNQMEVVNGAGRAYSRDSEVITPGAVGSSVGIEQCFTVRDWQGGALAVGTKDGTYPKISNADGWVSVAGYSADSNPIIQGKVKMFSISFRARTTVTGNGIAFDFATDENVPADVATMGAGYDQTCNGLPHGLAYWSIYNASGNGGESGYFEFKHEPFPKFNSRLVVLQALGLSLTYGDNNNPVTDNLKDTDPYNPGWNVNWSNSNVIYTLTADPYRDASKTQPGASFPQVRWKFDTAQVTGANNLNRTWEDYITILDQQDTYVRFKINPNFTPVTNEDPGYIRVTATSQHYTSVNVTGYVSLRSYSAPATLELAQKDGSDTPVRLPDNAELVYHYTADPGENREFWVDFGGATQNTEVVWSLLDKNGDPINLSDPDAKVTFTRNSNGTVTINPHYTTQGDDYVTLHVESLYDASKCDEVKIKVQLYATNLGFSPKTVRMSVMKDGAVSAIDLKQYLQVQPVDVYATNYTWEILSNPTRDPANATEVDPGFVSGTDVVYGTLGTGSTAATFTAFEWATPKKGTDGEGVAQDEEFVTVRATDTLSGKTADVKIAIMDLDSPIGIDQFAATNNLGYVNDTVLVKSGLKLGDVLTFYPSYEDAVNRTNMYSQTTIMEGMYPYFTFVVGNRDGGVMKGEGGFLAVTLTRQEAGAESAFTYDPVPVSYSAEPSLVDGYIHLFGKTTGSIADQGVRVDLEGLNFKETVYTDATGYFKFTKYIAPGTYKMVVTKQNYLTRRLEANSSGVGGLNIQVNDSGEFHISTYNQPILLFPGELNNDNAITVQDINYYVANWVGQYDQNIVNYDLYDFYEDGLISLRDLELLLMRKDWVSGSYSPWTVPNQ